MVHRLSPTEKKGLAQVGTPSEVHERITKYTHAVTSLSAERGKLIKKYPKQWVALYEGKVVCTGKTLPQLMASCEKEGIARSDIVMRYLNTEKRVLIL